MNYNGHELPLGISIGNHPAKAIDDFVAHGFRYFEIGIPANFPDQAVNNVVFRGREKELVAMKLPLKEQIENNGLRVWSVHLPFGFGWDIAHYDENERRAVVESLKRIIDATIDWFPKTYVLHGCLEPVASEHRSVRIAGSIRSVHELDEYAAVTGARIALENLPRSCLANNSTETRAMAQAAGNIPVCFDVNHLLGETHADFMAVLARNVITTHLSDYDGINERHWLPGKGIVPWKEIVNGLINVGYRGPYLFELNNSENGPYSASEIINSFETVLK